MIDLSGTYIIPHARNLPLPIIFRKPSSNTIRRAPRGVTSRVFATMPADTSGSAITNSTMPGHFTPNRVVTGDAAAALMSPLTCNGAAQKRDAGQMVGVFLHPRILRESPHTRQYGRSRTAVHNAGRLGNLYMNIKRGLFRIWLVCSIFFVIGNIAFSYSFIRSEFVRDRMFREGGVLIPVKCGQARGELKTDYKLSEWKSEKLSYDSCWYSMGKFRTLFPEYRDLDDLDLIGKTYDAAGEAVYIPEPWQSLQQRAAIALGFPLGIFIIGFAFVWAFSGFARPKAS